MYRDLRRQIKGLCAIVAILCGSGLILEAGFKPDNLWYLLGFFVCGITWLNIFHNDINAKYDARIRKTFGLSPTEVCQMFGLSRESLPELMDDFQALTRFMESFSTVFHERIAPHLRKAVE